ncbi:hypothetical protein F8388_009808 [Cannabis sativa]|uniref:Anaphase-promoting complex subunit 11 n=1 Tax=Cannabis sativa TaxID=3483 RepID=A0A7J6H3H6_CANSA|nr:hypothetical protein G4B88_024053 [Cannabis sativa]KAF4389675.1 hypothetical protein F8388_009808 [Cannabis sativa]
MKAAPKKMNLPDGSKWLRKPEWSAPTGPTTSATSRGPQRSTSIFPNLENSGRGNHGGNQGLALKENNHQSNRGDKSVVIDMNINDDEGAGRRGELELNNADSGVGYGGHLPISQGVTIFDSKRRRVGLVENGPNISKDEVMLDQVSGFVDGNVDGLLNNYNGSGKDFNYGIGGGDKVRGADDFFHTHVGPGKESEYGSIAHPSIIHCFHLRLLPPSSRSRAGEQDEGQRLAWHAVASWTWDAQDETCGICRMAFDGCCPDCKLPGDDCPLIWGACNHAFHLHCILKWVNSQTSQAHCPMCRREWQFKG